MGFILCHDIPPADCHRLAFKLAPSSHNLSNISAGSESADYKDGHKLSQLGALLQVRIYRA